MSFDAFGKRRNLLTLADLVKADYDTLNALTTQGFTGHEMVDDAGVIHMGGRIYDPKLARFMSADPIVSDLTNVQRLNRYSYVLNSPLSYTDPTGFDSTHDCPDGNCNNGVYGYITVTAQHGGTGLPSSMVFGYGGGGSYSPTSSFSAGTTTPSPTAVDPSQNGAVAEESTPRISGPSTPAYGPDPVTASTAQGDTQTRQGIEPDLSSDGLLGPDLHHQSQLDNTPSIDGLPSIQSISPADTSNFFNEILDDVKGGFGALGSGLIGVGDAFTFGGTAAIRDYWNWNVGVDTSSASYRLGQGAGTAIAAVLGGVLTTSALITGSTSASIISLSSNAASIGQNFFSGNLYGGTHGVVQTLGVNAIGGMSAVPGSAIVAGVMDAVYSISTNAYQEPE